MLHEWVQWDAGDEWGLVMIELIWLFVVIPVFCCWVFYKISTLARQVQSHTAQLEVLMHELRQLRQGE